MCSVPFCFSNSSTHHVFAVFSPICSLVSVSFRETAPPRGLCSPLRCRRYTGQHPLVFHHYKLTLKTSPPPFPRLGHSHSAYSERTLKNSLSDQLTWGLCIGLSREHQDWARVSCSDSLRLGARGSDPGFSPGC